MNTKNNQRGTQQRQRILDVLRSAARMNKHTTLSNIADALGLHSATTVLHHMRRLERDGMLIIDDGRISLTSAGRGYPADEALLWVCWRVLSIDHPRTPIVEALERRLGL